MKAAIRGRIRKDTGVAPGLTDRGIEVYTLIEVELLEREDLLKILIDLIRLAITSLLAIL